jgi:hypothetical protein
MTEVEWLTCANPGNMLEFLRGKASDRKWWLFAAACCRCAWHLLPIASRQAVEAVELYADRRARERDIIPLVGTYYAPAVALADDPGGMQAAQAVGYLTQPWQRTSRGRPQGAAVSRAPADPGVMGQVARSTAEALAKSIPWEAARREQVGAIRCIFGNPYRPVSVDPHRLTSTVACLAQGIYDDRAFDRLPILAAALLDSGCNEEELIQHCRSDKPHVRGCWAVDAVLGRS